MKKETKDILLRACLTPLLVLLLSCYHRFWSRCDHFNSKQFRYLTQKRYFFDFVNWVVIRKAGGQRPLRFVPGTTYEPIRELARRANLDRVMRQHRRQRLRRTIRDTIE